MALVKDSAALKKAAEAAVQEARTDIKSLPVDSSSAFLRLAFYDAILHNHIGKDHRPSGSIRMNDSIRIGKEQPSLDLRKAITQLETLRGKKENVKLYLSYADLYQLAGIEAVKRLTGMDIAFQHGRADSCLPIPEDELEQFKRIQKGEDFQIVRTTFSRLGFNDKEIVALFSAIIYLMDPSLFPTVEEPSHVELWSIYEKLKDDFKPGQSSTKVTCANPNQGSSSTINSNVEPSSKSGSSAWCGLVLDASFREYVELFAKDSEQFSLAYKSAHQKLSELGFQSSLPRASLPPASLPPAAIVEYHDMKHGIAFAVAMTIIFGFVGFFYEAMRS
ncbi:hypothetical protein GOP47_0027600 [Adiantum capillus-veneris]|nr:hypothetical protein GOP47_0027600 [Adiantum capillus-veneris]